MNNSNSQVKHDIGEQNGGDMDVVVVGGGPAGLSAALILGRSRRRVLVVDSGMPRNAASPALHAFLTRDGVRPSELLALGREQLRSYDGVRLAEHAEVADVSRADGQFRATVTVADGGSGGGTYTASKLLLATGVEDVLPEVAGLRELWGTGVFHCPYCHGWEVRDQPLAVYGRGESGHELALLLTGWSRDLVLVTDGPADLSHEQRAELAANRIPVREERVARLVGADGGTLEAVEFIGGERLVRHGLFVRPQPRFRTALAKKLGCELATSGAPITNERGETSVAGVYVAGDATGRAAQAIGVAGDGAMAAYAINRTLVWERLAATEREVEGKKL
jgi:thioredoxin reductase